MGNARNAVLHSYFDCFKMLSNSELCVSWLRTPCYSKQLYISKNYENLWDHSCSDLVKNPDSWSKHLIPAESKNTDNNKEIIAPVINHYKIKGRNKRIIEITDFTFPIFDDRQHKIAIGGFATAANSRISETKAVNRNVVISKQELICLSHTLQGMTAQEIAAKLNLSKRTVETYLENLKDKTGCQNKMQLIAYACTNSEIQRKLNTL